MTEVVPEQIQQIVYDGFALCSKFNMNGKKSPAVISVASILAVGCIDGRIKLYDWTVRGLSRSFLAHSGPVDAVTWRFDQRVYASASRQERCVRLWGIHEDALVGDIRFDSPVCTVDYSCA